MAEIREERLLVWYPEPDPDGYHLIVRQIEGSRAFRIELQNLNPQYVPFCTATVLRGELVDITTPTWNRRRGHASRLVRLAMASGLWRNGGLRLSAPSTWRGLRLYDRMIAEFPSLVSESFELNREEEVGRLKGLEAAEMDSTIGEEAEGG